MNKKNNNAFLSRYMAKKSIIKKQHITILVFLAVLLTGVAIFGKQYLSRLSFDSQFHTCSYEDGTTFETTEPCKDYVQKEETTATDVVENETELDSEYQVPRYEDVTDDAVKQDNGWYKYEFRMANVNNIYFDTKHQTLGQEYNQPLFRYSNYNLYFPQGWKVSTKEINGLDKNGEVDGDAGGVNLTLQKGDSTIFITQALYELWGCGFTEKKDRSFICQRFLRVNEANKNWSILSSDNYDDAIYRLDVCDHDFSKNQADSDYCTRVTNIGKIDITISKESDLSEAIEIIKRLEVVK